MSLLAGKRVLVTGGGRRVGAAIAAALRAAGAVPVIHCNRTAVPDWAETVRMDFLDGSPEELLDRCGRLDAVVNNASVFLHAGAAEQMRVNYEFPVGLLREFFRRFGSGCAVNMLDSSVNTHSDGDPYRESKFLLREATVKLAMEFAPKMRVNGVALGPVLPPDELAHLKMRRTLEVIPLRRPVALDDAAAAVLFMLANESITGAVLDVDCGMGMLS
ncbi:MAG: SDR family oxidoreductase [Victivallaceae bacterium]|nr:SDR family oxidoreductase [Victivallaceae bacterium]